MDKSKFFIPIAISICSIYLVVVLEKNNYYIGRMIFFLILENAYVWSYDHMNIRSGSNFLLTKELTLHYTISYLEFINRGVN